MLFLSQMSSFHPSNWDTLIPTMGFTVLGGLATWLYLKDKKKPGHASVRDYLVVAAVLTIVTILEVALIPISESGWVKLPHHYWLTTLYVMAIAKFVIVLMYFMHLYYDRWVYTALFGVGMALSLATFWAMLAMLPGEPVRTPEPYVKKAHGAASPAPAGPWGVLASLPPERLEGLSPEARGALVFEGLQCGHCHRVQGSQVAVGDFGPALDGIARVAAGRVPGLDAEGYLRQSILEPGAYVVRGYFNGMPALRARMTDQEVDDLVRYLLTLGGEGACRPALTAA